MKRVVVILLVLILLGLVGLGIFFIISNNKPVVEKPTPPPIVEIKEPAEEIVVNSVTTKVETKKRFIDVNMPAFEELTNFSFQESINKEIAELINPYINEIKIVSDDSISKQYKYYVDFERYDNDIFVSLVIDQNYVTGGMRSNAWKDTFTIDIIENKKVMLADICSSEDYKKIIVDEVNKQAKQKEINLVAGNGLVDIPDTQRFYIKDEKLYIYFEPASIAPYLDGEMHFEMPFEYEDGKFKM